MSHSPLCACLSSVAMDSFFHFLGSRMSFRIHWFGTKCLESDIVLWFILVYLLYFYISFWLFHVIEKSNWNIFISIQLCRLTFSKDNPKCVLYICSPHLSQNNYNLYQFLSSGSRDANTFSDLTAVWHVLYQFTSITFFHVIEMILFVFFSLVCLVFFCIFCASGI